MISDSTNVKTADFERGTGWQIKPEGACKDDRCVPLDTPLADTVELDAISRALGMPLVADEPSGFWALGPEAGGRALTSATAPPLELADYRGETFRLDSLRGKKVFLIAWASW